MRVHVILHSTRDASEMRMSGPLTKNCSSAIQKLIRTNKGQEFDFLFLKVYMLSV